MQTFFSESHRLHFPQGELSGGELVTPFERPSRVEYILQRLQERQFNKTISPDAVDFTPIRRLHDPGFLDFLEHAWDEWKQEGFAGELIISRRVLSVIRDKVSSAEKANAFSSRIGMGIGVAPVNSIMER